MEEQIDSKNKFLATVSHEIRTPLTAIVGFSQVLQEDDAIGADDRMLMVTSIVQQAKEVSDLIEDLLVASRAESGDVNVSATRLDVVAEIDRTLTAGGSFTDAVEFERPTGPIEAIADPARVRQILRNLLTNAERYGGPNVSVSVGNQGSEVVVDVIDDGPGLPEEEWEPIFLLYHRAHSDESRRESFGIGLAVSRQLAELMKGTLHYIRENNVSVFRLRLPAVATDSPPQQP
jgi:signal transduction histidine kinase